MTHAEFKARPNTTLLNAQPTLELGIGAVPRHGGRLGGRAHRRTGTARSASTHRGAAHLRARTTVFDAPRTSDVVTGRRRCRSFGRTASSTSASSGSQDSTPRRRPSAAPSATARSSSRPPATSSRAAARPSIPASLPARPDGRRRREDGHAVEFSSRSTAIDLAAPGEDIPVAHPDRPEPPGRPCSGTSFSAPIVAAAAAWVWTARPDARRRRRWPRCCARRPATSTARLRRPHRLRHSEHPCRRRGAGAATRPRRSRTTTSIRSWPGGLFASGRPPLTTIAEADGEGHRAAGRERGPGGRVPRRHPGGEDADGDRRRLARTSGRSCGARPRARCSPRATRPRGRSSTAATGRANRAEQVAYRNPREHAVSAYLDIWLAKGAARRATYTATVTVR